MYKNKCINSCSNILGVVLGEKKVLTQSILLKLMNWD